jgi:hypothetical protein
VFSNISQSETIFFPLLSDFLLNLAGVPLTGVFFEVEMRFLGDYYNSAAPLNFLDAGCIGLA